MTGWLRSICLAGALAFASLAFANPALSQQSTDPFGVEVAMPQRPMVFLSGRGKWESAFETITEALKIVQAYVEREGVSASGSPLVIYEDADDMGFDYKAALPLAAPLSNAPKGDLAAGQSPTGRAYKFVHRGSYDSMENTYEAITNFFDQKGLSIKDMFIEEYVTDPRSTAEDKLIINIFVPIK